MGRNNARRTCRSVSLGILTALSLGGLTACHDSTHAWILTDVSVSLPAITGREPLVRRPAAPAEPLEVRSGGTQTLLVLTDLHDDPARYDDERVRSFVVVLDGPPVEGQEYAVEPDNGRLLLHRAWLPFRRPYEGIEGNVKIESISAEGVEAHCVFRNIIRDVQDESHIRRGTFLFQPPAPGDPPLRQAGIATASFNREPGGSE